MHFCTLFLFQPLTPTLFSIAKLFFLTLADNLIKMYQDSGKKHIKSGALAAPFHLFKPNL